MYINSYQELMTCVYLRRLRYPKASNQFCINSTGHAGDPGGKLGFKPPTPHLSVASSLLVELANIKCRWHEFTILKA